MKQYVYKKKIKKKSCFPSKAIRREGKDASQHSYNEEYIFYSLTKYLSLWSN